MIEGEGARRKFTACMIDPLLAGVSALEPLEVVPKQVESLLF
jgi:hypothetical protein